MYALNVFTSNLHYILTTIFHTHTQYTHNRFNAGVPKNEYYAIGNTRHFGEILVQNIIGDK